jgi:hypothetical protein
MGEAFTLAPECMSAKQLITFSIFFGKLNKYNNHCIKCERDASIYRQRLSRHVPSRHRGEVEV